MTSRGAGGSRDMDARLGDSERVRFVENCLEQGMLLEGLIALAVIDDPSTLTVFQTGQSRAQFFDSLGDVHMMVDVMREWYSSQQEQQQQQNKCNTSATQLQKSSALLDRTSRCVNDQVKESQKQGEWTWCVLKGLDEAVLQRIETSVQALHVKLKGSLAPTLRLNHDVTAASSALTSALCAALHARLCVYRGHAWLGYHELSTARNIRVSRNCFSSLLNRAPAFVLVAAESECEDDGHDQGRDAGRYTSNTSTNDQSKKIAQVLVNVSDATAAEMIKKAFGPKASIRAVKKTCTWERFVIPNVGLHCGEGICRVASGLEDIPTVSEANSQGEFVVEGAGALQRIRRRQIVWTDTGRCLIRPVIDTKCDAKHRKINPISRLVIDYDRETRTLWYYAEPGKSQRRIKADVRAELENQQIKATKLVMDCPFPYVCSPLKLQISEGLMCYSMRHPGEFHVVEAKRKSIESSLGWEVTTAAEFGGMLKEPSSHDSSRMFRFETCDDAKQFLFKMEAKGDRTKTEYSACFRHAMQEEEPVSYNSQVTLNAVWVRENEGCETSEEANERKIEVILERLLTGSGLRVDPVAEDCTRVRTFTNPFSQDSVYVSITFSTTICARQGAQVVAAFAESAGGRRLVVEGRDELSIALRTLSVRVSAAVWAAVRTDVKDRLDSLRQNAQLLSHYEIADEDQISSSAAKNCNSISPQTLLLKLIAVDINCVQRLREAVESVLRPTVVKVDRAHWRHLHAPRAGRLWLRAVTHMTGAHVHLPQWVQQVWVYGSVASRDAAARLLLEQAPTKTGEENSTVDWNFIDFKPDSFRADAVVSWIKDFEALTGAGVDDPEDKQENDVVRDWFFDEEYLHVWIKTERSQFQNYVKSVEAKYAAPPAPPNAELPEVTVVKKEPKAEDDNGFDFDVLWGEAKPKGRSTKQDLAKQKSDRSESNDQKVTEMQENDPQMGHSLEISQVACPPAVRQLYVEDIQEVETYEKPGDQKDNGPDLCCRCCQLKFTDASDEDRYVMEACGHVYCTRCLGQTITCAVRDNRLPLHCCAQRFTVNELRYACGVVRNVALDEVLCAALKRHFGANSAQYRFRPGADSDGVCQMCAAAENLTATEILECQGMKPWEENVANEPVEEEKSKPVEARQRLDCFFCFTETYSDCMDRYHGPTSRCDEDRGVQTWMHFDQSTRKLCPSCKIEKLDVCNVYCVSCLHYVCWTCSRFHDEDLMKVYNHFVKEHVGYSAV